MLSFFIVYMSHRIKPSSVKFYLSGICTKLEPIWPDVQSIRTSPLVTKSLTHLTFPLFMLSMLPCFLTLSHSLLVLEGQKFF